MARSIEPMVAAVYSLEEAAANVVHGYRQVDDFETSASDQVGLPRKLVSKQVDSIKYSKGRIETIIHNYSQTSYAV